MDSPKKLAKFVVCELRHLANLIEIEGELNWERTKEIVGYFRKIDECTFLPTVEESKKEDEEAAKRYRFAFSVNGDYADDSKEIIEVIGERGKIYLAQELDGKLAEVHLIEVKNEV